MWLDGWTVKWIRTWLDGCIQRISINGSTYKYESVMSSVPQGSVRGLVLFNIFSNNIGSEIMCILSKFADDSKLSNAVSSLEGRAIQWDLDSLEVGPCELHEDQQGQAPGPELVLGKSPISVQSGERRTETSPVEKDFGTLVDEKLYMSWQCALAAQKANHILD